MNKGILILIKVKKVFVAVLLAIIMLYSSCGDDEAGACTISCGGAGTGQPFVWTNYPNKTESDCKKLGEDKKCKASYGPPTGNSNDCFQVYP